MTEEEKCPFGAECVPCNPPTQTIGAKIHYRITPDFVTAVQDKSCCEHCSCGENSPTLIQG